ncbi:EcsC family protein [Paenibacillus thermoaerophilus]|uniref:EcsC family protein n=1 Tax=Paenibacillus thermoaerophilus TaxID=1215385 RepID=A0ABW2V7Z6_9BACL|nr:EcsC family protein [Paenibacillus thermoaerophilus]TMV16212.1 EcsC family protein [Paenibacillus thermoaerophilus]
MEQGADGRAPESREQLLAALGEIEVWEREQKDLWFWEKLGRLPFQLLDKLTPTKLQHKIGQALDEIGGYVQTGGRYLVSEQSVQRRLSDACGGAAIETIGQAAALPLSAMDRASSELAKSRSDLAAVQGATVGFGGLFTLAIDIPAVLALSLKVLQETAICYGYDPNRKEERIFIVKCLQFASSDIVGKRAVLEELASYGSPERAQRRMVSQLQGWREVVAAYRDNFGWKKLFQMIPIAGMIFGAAINRSTLKDVGEAGRMLYRKRRVLERLQMLGGTGL